MSGPGSAGSSHCGKWTARIPKGLFAARLVCTLEPDHEGKHYNHYVDRSWRDDTDRSIPLSARQTELLGDIAANPAMYITHQSRWDQTATALIRKGLAVRAFGGGPGSHQYELRITESGRAQAARRGLG